MGETIVRLKIAEDPFRGDLRKVELKAHHQHIKFEVYKVHKQVRLLFSENADELDEEGIAIDLCSDEAKTLAEKILKEVETDG